MGGHNILNDNNHHENDDENDNNTDDDDDDDNNDNKLKETRIINKTEYSINSTETIELEWQQKIFSHYEIEYYKDIQNCVTDLQKEYHEWIVRDNLADNNNRIYTRIFTYVDSDNFIPDYSDDLFPQIQTDKETTLRAQKFSHPYTKSKVMYIYADLNPDTLLFMLRWLETEQMLIVYPDFNQFDHNPYFIEIDSDYRHLYSYAVHNISTTTTTTQTTSATTKSSELILSSSLLENSTAIEASSARPAVTLESTTKKKSKQEINKLQFQLNSKDSSNLLLPISSVSEFNLQKNNLSSIYDMPPKQYIRINFLFNIIQAQQFEYNSLHVRYYIKLPKTLSKKTTKLNPNTKKLNIIPDYILEYGHLNGTTHSSDYKWNENDLNNDIEYNHNIKVWNFSYPFQLTLLIREQELQNNQNSLQIYFELISIDSWQRERIEGYTFILIPIESGIKNYNLKCYRPDYGFKDRIERFFIGGRKIFNFENFNKTNNIKDDDDDVDDNINSLDNFLNRFHTKCISTGILNFHTECILQRNPNELNLYGEYEIKKKTKNCMTLDDIMRGYQEARKRLEATTLINETDI